MHLTRKAFDVLVALVNAAPRVVSKDGEGCVVHQREVLAAEILESAPFRAAFRPTAIRSNRPAASAEFPTRPICLTRPARPLFGRACHLDEERLVVRHINRVAGLDVLQLRRIIHAERDDTAFLIFDGQ